MFSYRSVAIVYAIPRTQIHSRDSCVRPAVGVLVPLIPPQGHIFYHTIYYLFSDFKFYDFL